MKKQTRYLLINIIFPLVIITIFFVIAVILSFNNYINVGNLSSPITVQWGKISLRIISFIVGIVILVLLLKFIRKKNNERVFLDGDYYGFSCWFIYRLASWLGFKKISLKRKPYKIILKLLESKLLHLVDKSTEDTVIKFDYNLIKNLNSKECNIIISDTYKIKMSQIPQSFHNFKTYIFESLEAEGKRIFSTQFMDEVGKKIIQCRSNKIKINLFMTTNVENTRYLLNEYVLVGGRDFIEVQIFQMDTSTSNKKFKENGYTYNGGNN